METLLRPYVHACVSANASVSANTSKGATKATAENVTSRLTVALDALVMNICLMCCTWARLQHSTRVGVDSIEHARTYIRSNCGSSRASKTMKGGATAGMDTTGLVTARFDAANGMGVSTDANLGAGLARGPLATTGPFLDMGMMAGGSHSRVDPKPIHAAVKKIFKNMHCTLTKASETAVVDFIVEEWGCFWHVLCKSPLTLARVEAQLNKKCFAAFS